MKHWLSPSSWASYFQSGDDANLQRSLLSHDLASTESHSIPTHSTAGLFNHQAAEGSTSENVAVYENTVSSSVKPTNSVRSLRGVKTLLLNSSARNTTLSSVLGTTPAPHSRLNFNQDSGLLFDKMNSGGHYSEHDQERSTDDSDVSWVAEDNGDATPPEVEKMEQMRGNSSSQSDESWIAEDNDDTSTVLDRVKSRVRPLSISLVEKELSDAMENGSPSTPFSYVVGEGTAGVAQQSTLLLTPGAEVTVQYVANPTFSNKPPRVTFSNTTSEVAVHSGVGTPMISSTVSKLYTSSASFLGASMPQSSVQEQRQEVVSL